MRGFLAVVVFSVLFYGFAFLQAKEAVTDLVILKAETEYFSSSLLDVSREVAKAEGARVKW